MKKYINNKFKLCALLLATLATSCEQDYQAVDLVSDVAWFTSEVGSHPGAYELCEGTVVAFMDASQGAKSHQWIIEEGSQFMVNGFDFKAEDIEGQIDPDKGLTSTERVENVIFNTPGATKVTLRNTFYEWVRSHDSSPIEAVVDMENQEWVWEKSFDVEIYGKLKPAFSVSVDGNNILDILEGDVIPTDQSKWARVNLEIGSKIVFTDNTTADRPDGRDWVVPSSSEGASSAAEAGFSFNAVGEYKGFTLTVNRERPAEKVKLTIPLIVNVTASTDDFEVKSIAVDTNNPAALLVSGNGSFATATDNQAANFTLSVKTSEGVEIPGISIVGVTADPTSMSELKLELSERLYAGEIATVSYTSDNGIISTDDRPLCSFAPIEATNKLSNSNVANAKVSAFGDSVSTIQNAGWYTETKTMFLVAEDPADATNVCAYFDIFEAVAQAKPFIMHKDAAFEAPAGSYVISIDMYIPSTCTVYDAGDVGFTFSYKSGTNAIVDMPETMYFPSLADGRDKWVTKECEVTFKEDIVGGKIKINFPAAAFPVGTKLYMDNIEIYSARPAVE